MTVLGLILVGLVVFGFCKLKWKKAWASGWAGGLEGKRDLT